MVQIGCAYALRGSAVFTTAVTAIVLAVLGAIVIVIAGADASGTMPGCSSRIERIIERAWAIILVDFAVSLGQESAVLSFFAGKVEERVYAFPVLFMLTMLIYAEPYIALEEHVNQLTIIPLALMRSMMLAWVNMRRILGFFALNLVLAALSVAIVYAARAFPAMALPVNCIVDSIFSAAFAVLCTVAYLDTVRLEGEAAA